MSEEQLRGLAGGILQLEEARKVIQVKMNDMERKIEELVLTNSLLISRIEEITGEKMDRIGYPDERMDMDGQDGCTDKDKDIEKIIQEFVEKKIVREKGKSIMLKDFTNALNNYSKIEISSRCVIEHLLEMGWNKKKNGNIFIVDMRWK